MIISEKQFQKSHAGENGQTSKNSILCTIGQKKSSKWNHNGKREGMLRIAVKNWHPSFIISGYFYPTDYFWPWDKADKRYMEAEEAKAKLEMESNTIPERLATRLNVEHDLIGPIEADRGDPYALQVSEQVTLHYDNSITL